MRNNIPIIQIDFEYISNLVLNLILDWILNDLDQWFLTVDIIEGEISIIL